MENEYIGNIKLEIDNYLSENKTDKVGTPLILIAKLLVSIDRNIESIASKMYE